MGSIKQWRDFPEALVKATGLPALLYDRCGFGGSQPLEVSRGLDYFAKEVESLNQLLNVCAIAKPLLVGHSDGATLALLYAASFPNRPVAIISEAAHLFVEDITITGIKDAVERWRTTDFRQRLERYHGAQIDAVFSAWADTWLDPAFRQWNIEAQMENICCPVLAMQGADDMFGTSRQLKAISTGVGGSCLSRLIAECGHSPHLEAREVVLTEMADFIGDITAGLNRPPERMRH